MLGLHRQTNNDTKSPQQYSTYENKKITLALLYVGFNLTSPYINKKERCAMLGLLNKPTLTPKDSMLTLFLYVLKKIKKKQQQQKKQYSHFKNIFNVGINPTSLYIHVHEESGVQFWVCMTNIDTKSLQCWIECSTHQNEEMNCHAMHICLVMLILILLVNFYI